GDGADRRSRAPAPGFPPCAAPTIWDRRSATRVESCRASRRLARRSSALVPGLGEVPPPPEPPPSPPASCGAIPNALEPSSQSSPFLRLILRLVRAIRRVRNADDIVRQTARSGLVQPESVEPDHVVDAEIIFRIVALHKVVPDIEDILPRHRH